MIANHKHKLAIRPQLSKSKTALADNTVKDTTLVTKKLFSPEPREPVVMPSSPPNPPDLTLTSVPKTSSSQTSTPLLIKLRSPSPPPEDPTKNKTARSPREPSTSTVQSPSPRNTTTHPRDNTPHAKMEKVLPKPEPEPRSKTTSAPRLISHAQVVVVPDVDALKLATPANTEMFD